MPSNSAAITTSLGKGVTLELVTRRWGVTPLGVEREERDGKRRGAGTGSGKTGDGIGETGHSGRDQEIGRRKKRARRLGERETWWTD